MSVPNKFDILIVGGLGHVGLPLGLILADHGLQVSLYDIDQDRRAQVAAGRMPFLEYGAKPLLKRVIGKTLHLADGLEDVAQAELVMVTIGTPLDERLNPKLLPMLDLAKEMVGYLRNGQHVMLRSTVYPGTSRRLRDFFASRGLEVHLSFCPERIIQGHAIHEFTTLPQIVSGFSGEAIDRAERLFQRLQARTVVVPVLEAELAKLFTNSWRYIQFAIANQFYTIATERGADFRRIHRAMTDGYERAKDFPGPGFAAGPCLLKDTMQLASFCRGDFQLGEAAMRVNEGLPAVIIDVLLREHGADLANARVGILGMAFKADIDDVRDSLSYKLMKLLKFHGAEVVCSDEYVKDQNFVSKEDLLDSCPIIVVGVPHSAYRDLKVPEESLVIDLWNVLDSARTTGDGVR